MSFMNWSPSFVTAIAFVDQQHQGLVGIVNQLADLLAHPDPCPPDAAATLVGELVHYARDHFAAEEALMVQRGIDARHVEHHRALHRDFGEAVLALRDPFLQAPDAHGDELLRFLSSWLAFHILGEDQRLAGQIRLLDEGHTAAEAFESIEGDSTRLLRAANDVLVHAMVDMFGQMNDKNRQLAQQNRQIEAANAQLEAWRHSLEDQVRERTAELRTANTELLHAKDAAESALRAKNRFLGTVSHELLTPLNAIMGFAHVLAGSDLPVRAQEHARRIDTAAEQLKSVIDETLLYSRLDTDQVNVDLQPFRPTLLMGYLAEYIARAAHDKGLGVNVDIDPALPTLLGDEPHLRQALQALASNAVKFTASGHIELRARQIEALGTQRRVAFEVTDTGVGIPLDRQPALFRAFEQLDSGTTRRYGGIGLGLALCSRLVRLLGGELTLVSTPGSGSTFRIELVLEAPELAGALTATTLPQQAAAGDGNLLPDLGTLETLLAEDDLEARLLFERLRPRLDTRHADTTELARHVGEFDFSAALQVLQRIIAVERRVSAPGTGALPPA